MFLQHQLFVFQTQTIVTLLQLLFSFFLSDHFVRRFLKRKSARYPDKRPPKEHDDKRWALPYLQPRCHRHFFSLSQLQKRRPLDMYGFKLLVRVLQLFRETLSTSLKRKRISKILSEDGGCQSTPKLFSRLS